MPDSTGKTTFETAGRQYTAAVGEEVTLPYHNGEVGAAVVFDRVLAIGGNEGQIGTPHIDGATVSAEIVRQGRDDTITVFKHKRRTGYRRTRGHRQPHTVVRITGTDVVVAEPQPEDSEDS